MEVIANLHPLMRFFLITVFLMWLVVMILGKWRERVLMNVVLGVTLILVWLIDHA